MKVGIDFDNTIACYTDVFYKAALEKNLIPKTIDKSKGSVRNYLRSIDKEEEWTKLQGHVYGARMDLAKPFEGVEYFFHHCHLHDISPYIISHRTKHPYLGPKHDLHLAANTWLQNQSFPPLTAFFELTLKEKLQRIETLQCEYFIDDLPELLSEPTFPNNVKKILFDPSKRFSEKSDFLCVSSWSEICDILGVPHAK